MGYRLERLIGSTWYKAAIMPDDEPSDYEDELRLGKPDCCGHIHTVEEWRRDLCEDLLKAASCRPLSLVGVPDGPIQMRMVRFKNQLSNRGDTYTQMANNNDKDYPNSGTLFRNTRRVNPKAPDYQGDFTVTCPCGCGRNIAGRIAAWIKQGARDKFMSLSFTAKDKQAAPGGDGPEEPQDQDTRDPF
jgi:hypothetical protein